MPTISIIIPAYNAEKTIKETIESVQEQTFSDWELIVINDGSNDKTLEIIQTISDERLRVFSYLNSGTAGAARNRGISHATGEYIAFLDADDLWTQNKLEMQLKALQDNPEAGVAYSWTYFIDEQGEFLYPCIPIYHKGNVYANLLLTNFLENGSNPLIRKQAVALVGEFNSSLAPSEDWDYYLRLAANWDFVLVPDYQIFYRLSSNSMSSQKVNQMKNSSFRIIEKCFQTVPEDIKYLKNKSLSKVLHHCSELYLRNCVDVNQLNEAGKNLWLSLRTYPQSLLSIHTQRLIYKYFKKRLLTSSFKENIGV